MQQRAFVKWTSLLNDYEMPGIDASVDEALLDFMDKRKASMADAWY